MIDIRPDPQNPRGGFAEITLSGQTADADPVMISVYNSYQQKWLGSEGWQANKIGIPARSAVQDGDMLRLIAGPDIVNKIEEDTPIRIEVGSGAWNTYWPDDINAGPDEAIIGGISGIDAVKQAKAPTVMTAETNEGSIVSDLSGPDQTNEDLAVEGIDEDDEDDELYHSDVEPNEAGRSRSVNLGLAAVTLAFVLAVLGYLYFSSQDDERADEPVAARPETEEPKPAVAPAPDACNVSEISNLSSQGFGAQVDKIRACGASLTADNALGFVEKAAADGDAEALALFGALYDDTVTDDTIEGQIGLTFAGQPSRAAEYYDRAVKAGSDEAVERLAAVCMRLQSKSDTLSQSAYEDYCQ